MRVACFREFMPSWINFYLVGRNFFLVWRNFFLVDRIFFLVGQNFFSQVEIFGRGSKSFLVGQIFLLVGRNLFSWMKNRRNSQIGENCIDTLTYQHHLQSKNKEPSCYKNPNNPSCIDLFLTNSPRSFYRTKTFFTGLSDFHKLVLSIFKTTFTKSKAKEIIYRDFKKFNEQCFNNGLCTELSSKSIKS